MPIKITQLGQQPYETTWQAMQDFTAKRTAETNDEIWLVEHPAVFTQGLNGKSEYLTSHATQSNIPIVQTDRGGQITYHAPGQAVVYLLIDLKRIGLGVKALVKIMEDAIIAVLMLYAISADTLENAPGVYVNRRKIASLGLKIKKQGSYHGLALNVSMDLTPFGWITPCGLEGMQMTQMADLTSSTPNLNIVYTQLCEQLIVRLSKHHNTITS